MFLSGASVSAFFPFQIPLMLKDEVIRFSLTRLPVVPIARLSHEIVRASKSITPFRVYNTY